MTTILKWTAAVLGVLALLLFFTINRGLASLAEVLAPGSAFWVHIILLALEALACFRLYRSVAGRRRYLSFDAELSPEERQRLARDFAARLRENPYLRHAAAEYAAACAPEAANAPETRRPDCSDPAFQDYCLSILRRHADQEIRRTAERIFLATALSQNGRLDALIVFVSLCRLVWRIATIYNQRPHPGEVAALYWSVATSVFLALSLEELDIATEIGVGFGEAFHAMVPATMTAGLPFVGAALQKFTASAIDGAANCYLALRTGIIARNAYAYIPEQRERPGRAAVFKEAGAMLLDMSTRLLEQTSKGLRSALWGLTRTAGGKTADTGRSLADGALRAGAGLAQGAGRLVSGTAQAAAAGGDALARAGKNAGSALGKAATNIGRAVDKAGVGAGRALSSPFRRKKRSPK